MIQTDKPKYKPGDNVRMRVFFVHPNGRPVNESEITKFHLQVRNVYDEIVYESTENPYQVQVYSKEFPLLDYAFEGKYKILVWVNYKSNSKGAVIVDDADATTVQYFEVEKYSLVDLDLHIVAKKNIMRGSNIVMNVFAIYSFGEYATGNATVRATEKTYAQTYVTKVALKGKTKVKINPKNDMKLLAEYLDYNVEIEVIFQDAISQKSYSKKANVLISKKERFTLVLDPVEKLFKPGKSLTVKAYLKDFSGDFVENSKDDIYMLVTQNFKTPICTQKAPDSTDNEKTQLVPRKVKNKVATFQFDVSLNTTSIIIEAEYGNSPNSDDNIKKTFKMQRQISYSRHFLYLTPLVGDINKM